MYEDGPEIRKERDFDVELLYKTLKEILEPDDEEDPPENS